MDEAGKQNQSQPCHQHGGSEPHSLVEVESGARERALPYAQLDVTRAHNGRAVGDVYFFQVAHASAQVAADSGGVSQGKVIPGGEQFAADAAAHIEIACEHGRTAIHLALEAHVAGADYHTAAHMTPVIHTQGLHQRIHVVAQLPVQVERMRKVVDVAFHR